MMRVLENIVAIIIVAAIIFACLTVEPGEPGSTDEVKYHKNCYYDDDGEEFCVDEYIPPERDDEPYIRW